MKIYTEEADILPSIGRRAVVDERKIKREKSLNKVDFKLISSRQHRMFIERKELMLI